MKSIGEISKYLCYILRHHPDEIGAAHEVMDEHGWVSVDTLIDGVNRKGKYHITPQVLEMIVSTDGKGRYRFDETHSKIKCCQGHSIDWVIPEAEIKAPPEFLYHGTTAEAFEKIKASGHISKMSRHAVHMQADPDKAKQSAQRWHRTPVILKISALQMYKDGYEFGVTENEVWCVESVPVEFVAECIYL